MAHGIIADQENPNIDLGRFLQDYAYQRDKKEVSLGHIKLDILQKKDGQVIVGEVKKTSKFAQSAKMQLAYYLLELEKNGIAGSGVLMFPKEKKREKVELTDEMKKELDFVVRDILRIVYEPRPLPPKKIHYCKNCAYSEFCWSWFKLNRKVDMGERVF